MKLIIIGTGSRGGVYARYVQEYGAEIVAVADPNEERLSNFTDEYNIPQNGLYKSWEEVFAVEKFADAVIISTPDKVHYDPAMAALEKGYHVLLEKPMSSKEQECRDMVNKSREKGLVLMVCHVLRYAPFYEKLKEIIDEGRIGRIVNLQHTENVAYWHFAHSFVRGIFRNETISSPWILAKSCHDLDIITYLMDKKCKSVVSKGNLMYFTKENTPEGAPEYCLDNCPHEKTCQYFAPALYLKQITNVTWPSDVISIDTSFASRYEALKKGPYGRCV